MTMAFSTFKFRLFLGIAVGFIYLAIVFVIVGLTTNYWLEIRDSNIHKDDVEMHFGLHRVCWSKSDRCNNPSGNYDKSNYLPKIQGVVITGAVLGLFASIMSLVHLFSELLENRMRVITIVTTVLSALSGLFLMIGCAMFGEKVEISRGYGTMFDRYAYKSYSFGLTTCAGGMMWIGAILIALANFCGKDEDDGDYLRQPPPYTIKPSAPSYAPSYAPSAAGYAPSLPSAPYAPSYVS